jgi:hypothetical protein
MRRPTRTPFHHSDLGGPFVAFTSGFHECDEDLRHAADSGHPLFSATRHRHWSAFALLIDALRHRRWTRQHRGFVVPGKRPPP